MTENNERMVDIISKLRTLLHDTTGVIASVEADASLRHPYENMFIEDRAIFIPQYLGEIEHMRSMDTDFGIIPYPKFDESQDKYLTSSHNSFSMFGIPIDAKNSDMSGAILEALCAESYKTVVPAFYEIALKSKYARDDESAEMLDIIRSGMASNFGLLHMSPISGNVGHGPGLHLRATLPEDAPEYTAYYEKNEKIYQKNLEDIIEAYTNLEQHIIGELMTKRERIITAMRHGIPDRVPVAPDFSAMIPCKRSGLRFYDVLLYGKKQLWQLYLDTCKHFGTEAWFIYGAIGYKYDNSIEYQSEIESLENGRLVSKSKLKTPDGDLSQKVMYFEDECETAIEKIIKNLKEDLPKLKHVFPKATGYDRSYYDEQVKALGDEGVMAVCIMPPGLHIFNSYFEGNLDAAVMAYYEEPELFQELCGIYERQQLSHLEIALELKVDSVLTGGSGSVTLQSPSIWEELSLPFIKKVTELCGQAGVITGIHSCGKEMHIVKTCAEQTELDYINPLEISPMGDCDLAECKKLYGDKLCLMGNLHTTNVMLSPNKDVVRLESLKAIRDAGENGSFILSTGDQCGRDTPDENIMEMVKISKEFGCYPLNMDKIECEIERLEKNIE